MFFYVYNNENSICLKIHLRGNLSKTKKDKKTLIQARTMLEMLEETLDLYIDFILV